MKKNHILIGKILAITLFLCFPFLSCDDDDKTQEILDRDKPVLVSSNPEEKAVIFPGTDKVTFVFDRGIVVQDASKITINDTIIKGAKVNDKTLTIELYSLAEDKDYALTIGKGAVMGTVGVTNQEDIVLNFSTTQGNNLELISTNPEMNEEIVPSNVEANLFFDQKIRIADTTKITLNNELLAYGASVSATKLTIPLGRLEPLTTYTINVAPGAISTLYGRLNNTALSLVFTTSDSPIETSLVTTNPSPEAVKVYNFLRDNFGVQTVSGSMANVNWNINEAEWVYKHTGKYPALNCFDYVHLYANWIDYTNTSVVEDWWNNNGLVAAMWHWNVPVEEGSTEYAFYAENNNFSIENALQSGTWENTVIMDDLNKVADRLLLLQNKNIPVIWRPLHEAAGKWFWWGAGSPEDCKNLWILMFNTFESKGLKNLIWVWTAESEDSAWYPGDEYVDIIGRDLYDKGNVSTIYNEYLNLVDRFSNKIIALSEMGSVANMSDQLNAGTTWSWFMPWYDYNRTKDPDSSSFNQTSHEHANINFWKNAFSNERVITRDKMPSLK